MPANRQPIIMRDRPARLAAVIGLTILLWAAALPGTKARTANAELLIVKSSDNAYYDETIATLTRHLDPAWRWRVVMADSLGDSRGGDPVSRVFLALGSESVAAVRSVDTQSPLVSAYLTHEQYRQSGVDRQFAVLLDQPLQRYLAFCKLILDLDSVGILLQDSLDPDPQLPQTLETLGLTLNQYRVGADDRLLPTLRELLHSNDALLMLPRQAIYNRDSLKGVLMTSYRSHKPTISYSPAHVKSGALAAIYSSPVDIGRHLALVLGQQLDGTLEGSNRYEFARFFTISINHRIARALVISLPAEAAVRSTLERMPL